MKVTNVWSCFDSFEDIACERVLTKILNDVTRTWASHDSPKDAFNLVPSLFNGMNIAFWRTAFEARTCTGSEKGMMKARETTEPWNVHT